MKYNDKRQLTLWDIEKSNVYNINTIQFILKQCEILFCLTNDN